MVYKRVVSLDGIQRVSQCQMVYKRVVSDVQRVSVRWCTRVASDGCVESCV